MRTALLTGAELDLGVIAAVVESALAKREQRASRRAKKVGNLIKKRM
jgi:hypothetical protein